MDIRNFKVSEVYDNKEFCIHAEVRIVGEDLCVLVTGGEKPHIGSVSISQPRPSLNDSQKISSTTSTFNFIGHKDDAVGNMFAQELSAAFNRNTVVLCGIHVDELTSQGIHQLLELSRQLLDQVKRELY